MLTVADILASLVPNPKDLSPEIHSAAAAITDNPGVIVMGPRRCGKSILLCAHALATMVNNPGVRLTIVGQNFNMSRLLKTMMDNMIISLYPGIVSFHTDNWEHAAVTTTIGNGSAARFGIISSNLDIMHSRLFDGIYIDDVRLDPREVLDIIGPSSCKTRFFGLDSTNWTRTQFYNLNGFLIIDFFE
jgi:hypothetical protein